MSAPIVLRIHGTPAPQGSKSAYIRGGHARLVEGGSKSGRESHVAWRQAVASAARDYLDECPMAPIDEPTSVQIRFRFAPVATDRYRTRHSTKPDLDKLVRSCLDSLVSSGILRDDSLVWDIHAWKEYAQGQEGPGADIEICPMGTQEAADRERRKARAAELRRLERTHRDPTSSAQHLLALAADA